MSSPLGTKSSWITEAGACGWTRDLATGGKLIWIASGVLCPLCEFNELDEIVVRADWNESAVFTTEDTFTCPACEQSFGISIDHNDKVSVEPYRP